MNGYELTALLQQDILNEVQRRGGSEELQIALETALSIRLSRIDPFQVGDIATLVKFRVRLEQAGADWIVTDSKMKESARNPLTILDQ